MLRVAAAVSTLYILAEYQEISPPPFYWDLDILQSRNPFCFNIFNFYSCIAKERHHWTLLTTAPSFTSTPDEISRSVEESHDAAAALPTPCDVPLQLPPLDCIDWYALGVSSPC